MVRPRVKKERSECVGLCSHCKECSFTHQKLTIDSQNPKRKALKHTTKENHETTKGKIKREDRNKEELEKQLENED